jgi:hypothetical protein
LQQKIIFLISIFLKNRFTWYIARHNLHPIIFVIKVLQEKFNREEKYGKSPPGDPSPGPGFAV